MGRFSLVREALVSEAIHITQRIQYDSWILPCPVISIDVEVGKFGKPHTMVTSLTVRAEGHDEELGGQDQAGDARLLKLGGRGTCRKKARVD